MIRLFGRGRRALADLRAAIAFERELAMNARAATPGPTPLVVVLDGLFPFANPAKVVRTADAFGAREVHLVGMRFFDPAPAVGSLRRMPLRSHDTLAACTTTLLSDGYAVFALVPPDANAPTGSLGEVELPDRTALIVGNERYGLSTPLHELPGVRGLTIPQVGIVQSLNASVAASIAVYEYDRQRRSREIT